MNIKTFLTLCILTVAFAFNATAQKIGYANVDLILIYMPETQTMNKQLQTYQQKLGEVLQGMQQNYEAKVQEARSKFEANPNMPEAEQLALQQELEGLQKGMQEEAAKSEQKLLKKRQDMMAPITEKLGNTIKAVAKEGSYDYILNSVDGQGVSIVLHGPESVDLTQTIMQKLGIQAANGQ